MQVNSKKIKFNTDEPGIYLSGEHAAKLAVVLSYITEDMHAHYDYSLVEALNNHIEILKSCSAESDDYADTIHLEVEF